MSVIEWKMFRSDLSTAVILYTREWQVPKESLLYKLLSEFTNTLIYLSMECYKQINSLFDKLDDSMSLLFALNYQVTEKILRI